MPEDIEEILVNEVVFEVLLLSLGSLTYVIVQEALVDNLIVLLNSQVVKILLYEEQLQSKHLLFLVPGRYHLTSLTVGSRSCRHMLLILSLLTILNEIYILKI